MLQSLVEDMIVASKRLSLLGQNEVAAHHESVIQLLGFLKIDQREVSTCSAPLKPLEELGGASGHRVAQFFEQHGDVHAGISEDGQRVVLLMYVPDHDAFDGLPIYWQNYFAQEMLPCFFMVCLEKFGDKFPDIGTGFIAIPYFTIFNCASEQMQPYMAVVGEDLRTSNVASQAQDFDKCAAALGGHYPMLMQLLFAQRCEHV